MDIGIAGIVVAIILGACSIISAVIFGYVPRKRQQELINAKNELLHLYIDVSHLLEVEKHLIEVSDKSKVEARKGQVISSRCEPARIKKRIRELEFQLQHYGTIQ